MPTNRTNGEIFVDTEIASDFAISDAVMRAWNFEPRAGIGVTVQMQQMLEAQIAAAFQETMEAQIAEPATATTMANIEQQLRHRYQTIHPNADLVLETANAMGLTSGHVTRDMNRLMPGLPDGVTRDGLMFDIRTTPRPERRLTSREGPIPYLPSLNVASFPPNATIRFPDIENTNTPDSGFFWEKAIKKKPDPTPPRVDVLYIALTGKDRMAYQNPGMVNIRMNINYNDQGPRPATRNTDIEQAMDHTCNAVAASDHSVVVREISNPPNLPKVLGEFAVYPGLDSVQAIVVHVPNLETHRRLMVEITEILDQLVPTTRKCPAVFLDGYILPSGGLGVQSFLLEGLGNHPNKPVDEWSTDSLSNFRQSVMIRCRLVGPAPVWMRVGAR